MSETPTLKIVSPDPDSVLVPLNSHFEALASTTEKAIIDRFQTKDLYFETIEARNQAYSETTGLPLLDATKPALTDGDICYIKQGHRFFVWNVDATSSSWTRLLKRLEFSSIGTSGGTSTQRDAYLSDNLVPGDTCYVSEIKTEFYWDGNSWQNRPTGAPAAFPTNVWYPPAVIGTSTSATLSSGRIMFIPFIVSVKGSYDAYNFNVVTGTTGATVSVALFNSDATTGLPTGSAITGSSGSTTATTSAQVRTITLASPITLQPGVYWIASFVLATSTLPTLVTTGKDTARGGYWWMPRGSSVYDTEMVAAEVRENTNTGTVAGTFPSVSSIVITGTTDHGRAPYILVRRSGN